jgi:T-complex protein 1 subunit theta
MTPPTAQEIGYCASVYVDEIGDSSVIVFKQESDKSPISTIIIRGATDNLMDDIERAIDDGVNVYKALTKDNRLLAGAGATEIELSKEVASYGEKCPGLAQYAIQKFAESLDELPRAIAANAGVKASEVLSMLHAAHQEGKKTSGVDIEAGIPAVKDAVESNLIDIFGSKYWAIKFAAVAACTVLRVDQIIMAKPAGGPKVKENKNWDED